MTDPKAPSAPSRFKLSTFGVYGHNLPVGRVMADGKLSKSFTLKPWRMKEEKQLAEWKTKYKGGLTLGTYVTQVLATMVESIGGVTLPESEVDRRMMLSSMFMADIMYMYVALRVEALGNELKMRLPCPACRSRFDFTADLNSLDIRTITNPADLAWDFKLRTPLKHRGDLRHTLTLRPTLWMTLESKGAGDTAGMSSAVIAGSITALNGIPADEFTPVPESALDELTKYDLEMLTKSISENSPGPVMCVEEPCSKCQASFFWPIDWGYDNFFSHSSL